MHPKVVSVTHQGRRRVNQDTVINSLIESGIGPLHLVAVLDGMGGMRAGDRASQLASQIFLATMKSGLATGSPDEAFLRKLLTSAVEKAHRAVYQEGLDEPEKRGMGTTLVAALEKDGQFLVVNVGDSRAYLWDPAPGRLSRLTRDHSLREEAVRLGKLTDEEASRSPFAHALTRAVGSGAELEADVFPEPTGWHQLPPGGVLLLCSDGLTGGLADQPLAEIVADCPDGATLGQFLLRAAYHGGSTDNISLVILADEDYHGPGKQPLPPPIEPDQPRPAPAAVPPIVPEVRSSIAPQPNRQLGTMLLILLLAAIAAVLLIHRFTTRVPLAPPLTTPPPTATPANPDLQAIEVEIDAEQAPPAGETAPLTPTPSPAKSPSAENPPAPAP